MLAFDLDPGPPAGLAECCEVAVLLREVLAQLSLESYLKTSGSKGMQLYVPLNSEVTYDDSKPFANGLARLLEKQHPKLVVSSMKKELRKGKVFIDWSQNDRHKTTVGRLLAARTRAPDRVDSAVMGRGRGREAPTPWSSRRARCSSGSRRAATSSSRC